MTTTGVMLQSVFAELDRRIEERWTAGNLSHGFWRTGAIPKLTPVDTLREYGFWQAKADLENGSSGQVSVALIGGHTRIGIFLPNRLLEAVTSSYSESPAEAVAKAHDGTPASIVRRVGGDTLFDRIFTETPFSAEWLLRCARDVNARSILENHLSWRVIDLWESALRTVMSQPSHDHDGRLQGIVIHSSAPLPPIVTESLPLTLQDVYEMQPGRWVTLATGGSLAGGSQPDLDALEAQLQALLPNHGITVQRDTIA
ncbi:hypothetical protein JKG47_02925 [Acidithiobacillus sp. MC6.1]|nr:hypothetical protein [Acidithiobacillus sp. MC6.1]